MINDVNGWVTGLQIEEIVRESNRDITSIARGYVQPRPTPPRVSPSRNYLVFDGPPRFGERKDEKGQSLQIKVSLLEIGCFSTIIMAIAGLILSS